MLFVVAGGVAMLWRGSPPGSALGYADYWPLTVTPQATRPKRSKPLMVTVGALIALSAALTLAFRHGIHAW